ncbi:glycine C-acetyltransferase [Nakamurella aerolata]|uniref:2-amino-3-ketobutyrate coenzyme A ligase n=1 Tax=Nakamurella aerolata TaxID=1656892 RepID=A0A849A7A9_9ACTN|nr:glycine C-acetyltransferase [Nakamurella aerolata]NNG35516.1 glycine C-acetyltransferase [Nakamurella aerolata]
MNTRLTAELQTLRDEGLYKVEEPLTSPQAGRITVDDPDVPAGREVINLCANNYLGLADHPAMVDAASKALQRWGFGMASVRFICGTTDLHTELEGRLAEFLGRPAAILYGSCFDANAGLFETLLGQQDAIISDELNHASIIDGVRLCKAQRLRYRNRDMADLRAQLEAAKGARTTMIATDGVFSMDGYLAPLDEICALAEEYGALVMVDDSHAVGFVGEHGAGTPELFGVRDRVDIVTGTLGKALGGASGGYTAASGPIVEMLRQRSRPYLFSNSVAPPIVAAAVAALDLLGESAELLARLRDNTAFFRAEMTARGFDIPESDHPIVPVMIGDAAQAAAMADRLLADGIYVRAFSFPVVPRGKARIRTQMSAAHTRDDLQAAIAAFERARG